MTDPRYFLVRCEATASALRLLAEFNESPETDGVIVTEIIPEKRDGSWMEVAIAARLAHTTPSRAGMTEDGRSGGIAAGLESEPLPTA